MVAITTGDNQVKERLSVGLVSLIAARAGCQVMEYPTDYESADINISPVQGKRLPIDAQLKASSNLQFTDDAVQFDLPVKNYNDLRNTEVGAPQLLVLVDLHGEDTRWIVQGAESLVFERSAYWMSLYGWPPTENQNTIRIDVPRGQVLTPDELRSIYDRYEARLANGEGGV